MTIPMAIFWLLLLVSFFNNIKFSFFLFFAMLPFADLSVVPAELGGGTNVLAASGCALTLILRTTLSTSEPIRFLHEVIACIFDMRRLGLMFTFVVISVVMTFATTSIFQGLITVINVPGSDHTVAFRGRILTNASIYV